MKRTIFKIIESHGDDIFNFIRMYHPCYKQKYVVEITAQKAEALCEEYRKNIKRTCAISDFKIAIIHKNVNLIKSILHEAWIGAPESISVRSHPGFYKICDILDS